MKDKFGKIVIGAAIVIGLIVIAVVVKLCMGQRVAPETADSGSGGEVQMASTEVIQHTEDGVYDDADSGKCELWLSGMKVTKAGWYDAEDTLKVEVDADGKAVSKLDQREGRFYKFGDDEKDWVIVKDAACQIDDNTYIFDPEGNMLKNQIAGDKDSGYYFVDLTGCKVTSEEIQTAVDLVMDNTDSSMTREQKLRACFDKIRSYPYERDYATVERAEQFSEFAVYAMKNEAANCYKYAAAFACVATVLGYEARSICGQMPAYYGDGLTDHSWTELLDTESGSWKIYDACLQRELYYGVDIDDYFPGESPVDATAQLIVSDGKVLWKWM